MSHISFVQTLVKASGKKSTTVFFLPKLLLSFTSTRPDACLDFKLKSGALLPTEIAIVNLSVVVLSIRCAVYKLLKASCQTAIHQDSTIIGPTIFFRYYYGRVQAF